MNHGINFYWIVITRSPPSRPSLNASKNHLKIPSAFVVFFSSKVKYKNHQCALRLGAVVSGSTLFFWKASKTYRQTTKAEDVIGALRVEIYSLHKCPIEWDGVPHYWTNVIAGGQMSYLYIKNLVSFYKCFIQVSFSMRQRADCSAKVQVVLPHSNGHSRKPKMTGTKYMSTQYSHVCSGWGSLFRWMQHLVYIQVGNPKTNQYLFKSSVRFIGHRRLIRVSLLAHRMFY